MDFNEAVFAVDSKSPEEVIEALDQITEFTAQYR
jgi:hypothetical protein